MNSDLIVMTFDGGEMAQTVYGALQAMRKSQVLGLVDSVIMTKDGVGRVRIDPGPQAGAGLTGLLAELILSPSGRVAPKVGGVELDDEFADTVVSALGNDSSALLFFVDSDGLSDTVELLEALALFRGTIHQTTLSPTDEALLRGML